MSSRLVLTAALGLIAPAVATAQPGVQLDRRDRDEPEVVVETGGRVGTCDVVRFSPDGKFLFAGGDDKVVRVWPVTPGGLVTEVGDGANKARVLRWPAWREQRGGIKAADVSPDGTRVVIGGYGMKPSTVAILNRETGATEALSWAMPTVKGENLFTVTATAFHPKGQKTAFATADGSVWVWDPQKLAKPDAVGRAWSAPVRVGKHTPVVTNDPANAFNQPVLLFFPDENTLGSVAESGEVAFFGLTADPAAAPPKPLRAFNIVDGKKTPQRAFTATLTKDRKALVIACINPLVLVQPLDGSAPVELVLPKESVGRSLAVDPHSGQLAVAVLTRVPGDAGKSQWVIEANDQIFLYANPAAGGQPTATFPLIGPAEAMAFHPTDGRLAIAGGDADEVKLLDPKAPAVPKGVVRGAGRRVWGVNISASGNVIGVQTARNPAATHPNARGAGDWAGFEPARLQLLNDPGQKWLGAQTAADGWTVEPDDKSRFLWWAVLTQNGAVAARHPLTLDRFRDQAPTCYTLIPAANGRPTRALVGHTYGCTLFELRREAATRTKLFIGHAGDVLSVVAHPVQNWFITGGADHTVATFSLEDWPANPGLGAKFEVKNGQLVVTAVDVGSPAWEAGLSANDVVDLLAVGARLEFDARAAVGNPDAALALLRTPVAGKELYFGVTTPGQQRRETLTSVRQRPLWKWFPGFVGDDNRLTDWLIYMWKGSYYYTESAHADDLIGWHVNGPTAADAPAFYEFKKFKNLYLKPGVVLKLVSTRSVGEALKALGVNDPPPGTFGLNEPAPVKLTVDRLTVDPAAGVTTTISVRPRGTNPDKLPARVEFWLNDHRMEVWPQPGGPPLDPTKEFVTPYRVPAAAFRAGENKISVLTFTGAGVRTEKSEVVTNEATAGPPNVLGVAVGIDDFAQNRKAMALGKREGFADLKSAVKDATTLADRLDAFRGPGRYFPDGRIERRLNAAARRKTLFEDIADARKRAKPNDLMVVFFAGHGDLPGARRGPAGPGGARGVLLDPGPFVFCCSDYSFTDVAGTSVSADDLFEALAGINCRKVVLLDACHAGGATDTNVLRRLIPNGQGPFVIAACNQSESSYEDPKLGHGLFTYAVLEAIGDSYREADENTDGAIRAGELFKYVRARVPQLMKTLQPNNTQVPTCFPRLPPDLVVVRK